MKFTTSPSITHLLRTAILLFYATSALCSPRRRHRLGNSTLGGVSNVQLSRLPPTACCTAEMPDGNRSGRCMWFSGIGGCIATNKRARKTAATCPAACGLCRVCEDHHMHASYTRGELHKLREKAARLRRLPSAKSIEGRETLDAKEADRTSRTPGTSPQSNVFDRMSNVLSNAASRSTAKLGDRNAENRGNAANRNAAALIFRATRSGGGSATTRRSIGYGVVVPARNRKQAADKSQADKTAAVAYTMERQERRLAAEKARANQRCAYTAEMHAASGRTPSEHAATSMIPTQPMRLELNPPSACVQQRRQSQRGMLRRNNFSSGAAWPQSAIPIADLLAAADVADGLDCRTTSSPAPQLPAWPHRWQPSKPVATSFPALSYADIGVGIMMKPSPSFLAAAGVRLPSTSKAGSSKGAASKDASATALSTALSALHQTGRSQLLSPRQVCEQSTQHGGGSEYELLACALATWAGAADSSDTTASGVPAAANAASGAASGGAALELLLLVDCPLYCGGSRKQPRPPNCTAPGGGSYGARGTRVFGDYTGFPFPAPAWLADERSSAGVLPHLELRCYWGSFYGDKFKSIATNVEKGWALNRAMLHELTQKVGASAGVARWLPSLAALTCWPHSLAGCSCWPHTPASNCSMKSEDIKAPARLASIRALLLFDLLFSLPEHSPRLSTDSLKGPSASALVFLAPTARTHTRDGRLYQPPPRHVHYRTSTTALPSALLPEARSRLRTTPTSPPCLSRLLAPPRRARLASPLRDDDPRRRRRQKDHDLGIRCRSPALRAATKPRQRAQERWHGEAECGARVHAPLHGSRHDAVRQKRFDAEAERHVMRIRSFGMSLTQLTWPAHFMAHIAHIARIYNSPHLHVYIYGPHASSHYLLTRISPPAMTAQIHSRALHECLHRLTPAPILGANAELVSRGKLNRTEALSERKVIARARAFLRETDAWRAVEETFLTPAEAEAARDVKVNFATGSLFGFSRSALEALVGSGCMRRVSEVRCEVPCRRSRLQQCEDAVVGLCMHLLQVPFVDTSCIVTGSAVTT